MDQPLAQMRVDKWLWTARFFKTRALAAEAISGGKVHVDGQRVKPSKTIRLGSRIEITKTPYTFEITVTGLSLQRRSAKEAALLYKESPESIARRQEETLRLRAEKASPPPRRPDKKQRRQLHRFKQASDGNGS